MHDNFRRPLGVLAIAGLVGLAGCASSNTSRSAAETTIVGADSGRTGETDWAETTSAAVDTQAQDQPQDQEQGAAETSVAAATEETVAAAAPTEGNADRTRTVDRAPSPEVKASRRPGTSVPWDLEEVAPPVTAPPTRPPSEPDIQARDAGVNPEVDTRDDNQSTFAMDVDTGSYTLARTVVNQGQVPSFDSVRTEEFVNYFDQNYPSPKNGDTFVVHVDGTATPFLAENKRIVRVGIQGRRVDKADRKPVRLTFVVDNSGSMEEDGKLILVQGALETLVNSLQSGDQIAIVGFSDDAWLVTGPSDASGRRSDIINAIRSMVPTDSTNAEAGLTLGYQQAQAMYSPDATNRVILLSDGVANVGPSGPDAILATIGDYSRRGIDLNTIGVGTTSYNDEMMERLADTGDGAYAYIDSPQEADRIFKEGLVTTVETIARGAKVQVEFEQGTVQSYRLLGFENRAIADQNFRNNQVDAGEIGAGHSITALYEVTLTDRALTGRTFDGGAKLANVSLRWEEPNGKVKELNTPLTAQQVASSFSSADEHLRLDITVAAYAEVLRQGPWSRIMDLGTVSANAQRLASTNFANDEKVQEFSRLTTQASKLVPRTW
jgi:Ca-activated chloride channel homolog